MRLHEGRSYTNDDIERYSVANDRFLTHCKDEPSEGMVTIQLGKPNFSDEYNASSQREKHRKESRADQ